MDGNEVDPSLCTAVRGSVNLDLSAEYLETLEKGDHELVLTFDDGESAPAVFTVKEEIPGGDETPGEDDKTDKDSEKPSDIPNTGDIISPLLPAVISVSSLAGLIFVVIKKKRENR